MSALLRSSAPLAMVGLALACQSFLPDSPQPADDPIAAQVGERTISVGEIDERIRDQLFDRYARSRGANKLYEMRAAVLEDMVAEAALEAAETATGLDRDQLITREIEVLGPVTDEEISDFFEKHRSELPVDELEDGSEQIRGFLERKRRAQALAALRSRADVSIALAPPRLVVEAAGPALGPENAPVTIVEFSDYQCPYCSRAEPTIKAILERYPDEVRFVYRHLPLDNHKDARGAAIAAVCADEQEKFWPFHEQLFANQRALSAEDLSRYASELGLDGEAFGACTEGDAAKQVVDSDVAAARKAGATGTPAFFVNGIPISGAKPESAFASIIDSELARLEAERHETP